MINLNEARDFIAKSEQRSRELEVEQAKLEQKKEYTLKSLDDNKNRMQDLGCTPENIESEIEKLCDSTVKLRATLESKLAGVS